MGRRINPWDETVYLPGYYAMTTDERGEILRAIRMQKILGREV